MANQVELYAKAIEERQRATDAIVSCGRHRRIVVAGPGTGKTYLFKSVLKRKRKSLTLTFVTSLVQDLSLELHGLSQVKTLHAFARSILKSAKNSDVKVYPHLSTIIKKDAEVILNATIDFDKIFQTLSADNYNICFYKARKDYYNHYGFTDIIFAALKFFEENELAIPAFEQIVVDEFQDFNLLEVSFIEKLATKSPILIAGDDDQALYETLKDASASHIRKRHADDSGFSLPYCSRCTRVIVEAVNDIISSAQSHGCLQQRIQKDFRYFECEEKDKISEANSTISYAQVYAKQIPWWIQTRIEEIAKRERGAFSVLIISPTNLMLKSIATSLQKCGMKDVDYVERPGSSGPVLLDGLMLLLKDQWCNLGWRIIAQSLLDKDEFSTVLTATHRGTTDRLHKAMPPERKREALELLTTLRELRDGKSCERDRLAALLERIGYDPFENAVQHCRELIANSSEQTKVTPAIRRIPVIATTVASSKGMAADYVFITHFDDQYLIKDADRLAITDEEICKILVALTRSKRRVFLISTKSESPVFLRWMDPKRITVERVNESAKKSLKETIPA